MAVQTSPALTYLDEIVRRLVQHFNPVQIVLFGSHARYQADEASDLDLLVVLDKVDHKRETTIAMRRVLSDLPVAKDIVVATSEEVARLKDCFWHVVGQAVQEGRVIYERT